MKRLTNKRLIIITITIVLVFALSAASYILLNQSGDVEPTVDEAEQSMQR